MLNISELRTICTLSSCGDTNSEVYLMEDPKSKKKYVQKIIYGIDQPIFYSLFNKEFTALYKLNSCENDKSTSDEI